MLQGDTIEIRSKLIVKILPSFTEKLDEIAPEFCQELTIDMTRK